MAVDILDILLPAPPFILLGARAGGADGRFHIFNDAEYRFYRSSSGDPPDPATDSPFATAASLPATPDIAWADGTWLIIATYFNGLVESDPLIVGGNGERWQTLYISGGVEVAAPPKGPIDWCLERRAGGVVAIIGVYDEEGDNRADEWSIAYAIGSDPAEDSPDFTVAIVNRGAARLDYSLPEQAHGADVRVRLQTRRFDDPAYSYSNGSIVKTTIADAECSAQATGVGAGA